MNFYIWNRIMKVIKCHCGMEERFLKYKKKGGCLLALLYFFPTISQAQATLDDVVQAIADLQGYVVSDAQLEYTNIAIRDFLMAFDGWLAIEALAHVDDNTFWISVDTDTIAGVATDVHDAARHAVRVSQPVGEDWRVTIENTAAVDATISNWSDAGEIELGDDLPADHDEGAPDFDDESGWTVEDWVTPVHDTVSVDMEDLMTESRHYAWQAENYAHDEADQVKDKGFGKTFDSMFEKVKNLIEYFDASAPPDVFIYVGTFEYKEFSKSITLSIPAATWTDNPDVAAMISVLRTRALLCFYGIGTVVGALYLGGSILNINLREG